MWSGWNQDQQQNALLASLADWDMWSGWNSDLMGYTDAASLADWDMWSGWNDSSVKLKTAG